MSLPNLVPRGDNTGSLGTASKRWSTIYAYNLDSSTPQSGIFSGSFSGSFEGDGSGLTGITATLPTGLVSGSSQISYNGITDVPSGILSSSAQIASDISGSFTEASSSFSTRVTTLESTPAGTGLWTGSGDFISRLGDVQITGSLTVTGSASSVNLQELQLDTNHTSTGHSTGRMYWDDSNKTATIDMQGSEVRLQVGQESHIYARNTSGVTINNGDAVRISGATGTNLTIELALSTVKSFKSSIEKNEILGLATEEITNNQSGYVTTFGSVGDLDTSAFNEGDILYLSHLVSGSYSNTRPPAPCFEARVGVVKVSNNVAGVILSRPAEPIFLTDISQVSSSGVIPNEKAYLVYDDSTDLINFTNEFSGSFSGSFQGDGSGLTGVNVVSSSYSVTASHATSVGVGSVDVKDLSATGTPSGTTYLRGDNTWATVAGGGDVSKVGTPVDNQVGVWTGDGTIEGNSAFTFDSTTGGVTATSFTGSINTASIDNFNTEVSRSAASAGFGTGGGTPLPSGLLSSSVQIASDISGSFTSTSASIAVNITTNLTNFNTLNNKTLVSGSSQISYTSITNVPSGILSSSSQIESEISGAFSDTSSSLAGRITSQENFSSSLDATFWTEAEQLVYSGSVSTRFTTNETDITNLQTDSGSFSTRVTNNETSITSLNANSSSYVTNSVTSSMTVASSSYAVTASYIEYNNVTSAPIIKNGLVAGVSFSGNPKTATITFTSPYVDNNYTITVSGEDNRTFTIESKISGSFVINSNANQTLSGNTFWQTINIGEFN